MRTEIRGDEIWPIAKALSKARDTSFETGEGIVGAKDTSVAGEFCLRLSYYNFDQPFKSQQR
jgi:hypothetical protein